MKPTHQPRPSRLAALCSLFTVLCSLASASEPSRKVVLTDGTNIWPENIIAPYKHAHEVDDVSGLEEALASKAALEHTHSQYLTSYTETDPTIAAWAKAVTKPTYNWTEIINRPTTWDWANLTNKPTTFPPATHNHDGTYLKLTGGTVTGNVTLNGTGNYVNTLIFGGTAADAGLKTRGIWGKPQGNTNQKAELYINIPLQSEGNVGTAAYFSTPGYGVYIRGGWGSDSERINYLALRRIDGDTLYATKSHTHAINEVTNLQAALDAKAAATHTHAIADTTGLQAALDGKAAATHTHAIAETDGLVEAIAEAAAPTGVATSNTIAYQKASLLVVTPDAEGAITWSLDTWPEGGQLVIRLTTGSATPTLPDWAHLLGYADLQPDYIYTLQAWRYGQTLYLNPVIRETIAE